MIFRAGGACSERKGRILKRRGKKKPAVTGGGKSPENKAAEGYLLIYRKTSDGTITGKFYRGKWEREIRRKEWPELRWRPEFGREKEGKTSGEKKKKKRKNA